MSSGFMWGTTPISQVFSTTAPPTTDTSNTIETFGQQPNTLYRTTDISLSGVNSPDTNLCGEYIVPTEGFLLNNISPGFSGDSAANLQDLGNNMLRSFTTYDKPGKYSIFSGMPEPPNSVVIYIAGAGGGCGGPGGNHTNNINSGQGGSREGHGGIGGIGGQGGWIGTRINVNGKTSDPSTSFDKQDYNSIYVTIGAPGTNGNKGNDNKSNKGNGKGSDGNNGSSGGSTQIGYGTTALFTALGGGGGNGGEGGKSTNKKGYDGNPGNTGSWGYNNTTYQLSDANGGTSSKFSSQYDGAVYFSYTSYNQLPADYLTMLTTKYAGTLQSNNNPLYWAGNGGWDPANGYQVNNRINGASAVNPTDGIARVIYVYDDGSD